MLGFERVSRMRENIDRWRCEGDEGEGEGGSGVFSSYSVRLGEGEGFLRCKSPAGSDDRDTGAVFPGILVLLRSFSPIF